MEFDLHKCRIMVSRHCRERLLQRFDTKEEGLIERTIRTGKLIKAPEKSGSVGIIEKKTKKEKIRIKFTYHEDVVYVITIERGRR